MLSPWIMVLDNIILHYYNYYCFDFSPDCHHGRRSISLRQHLDESDEFSATVLSYQFFLTRLELNYGPDAAVEYDV